MDSFQEREREREVGENAFLFPAGERGRWWRRRSPEIHFPRKMENRRNVTIKRYTWKCNALSLFKPRDRRFSENTGSGRNLPEWQHCPGNPRVKYAENKCDSGKFNFSQLELFRTFFFKRTKTVNLRTVGCTDGLYCKYLRWLLDLTLMAKNPAARSFLNFSESFNVLLIISLRRARKMNLYMLTKNFPPF